MSAAEATGLAEDFRREPLLIRSNTVRPEMPGEMPSSGGEMALANLSLVEECAVS